MYFTEIFRRMRRIDLLLRRADGPSLSLAIPGGMEYGKNQDLVGINLVDDDIRQSTHHPFMSARHTAAMSDAWDSVNRSAASRMRATTCVAAAGLRSPI
jgi:hypothetical protein